MVLMTQKAEVTWTGDLQSGSGRMRVASGAFPEQTVTFKARTEGGEAQTTPEELIAAAHATCYSMALSHRLVQNDTPPEELRVTAICSLDRVEGGLKITRMELLVDGRIPGVDGLDFNRLAVEAEQRCPVSNALRGNVEIELKPQVTTNA
jgi:osmotically inducible protein OsmC